MRSRPPQRRSTREPSHPLPSRSASDCVETHPWASRDGQRPIYNNRLFAKAFPYVVIGADSAASDDLRQAIAQGLQNALTQWGAALLANRAILSPRLRAYVESMLLCDRGTCQYTAPPAVEMRCEQHAAMVIRVYNVHFPAPQRWVGGMARKPGRTILLNAAEFTPAYDQYQFTMWRTTPPYTANITAVLAHELGHSFGLSHADPREASIMVPSLSDLATRRFVTPRDGRRFADVLSRDVLLGSPGEFTLDDCDGVSVGPPPDAR